LWEVPSPGGGPIGLNHGLELGRVRVGLDMRVSREVAIAPVIGADATMFLWQDIGGSVSAIGTPTVSTFVFAGIQGRLGVGGTQISEPSGGTTLTSGTIE
jgi:hypothetical protein